MSQIRAAEAMFQVVLSEIVPVVIKPRGEQYLTLMNIPGPPLEKNGYLSFLIQKDGTVTAGNASA